MSLTLCVPQEVEQTGGHESLWDMVHSDVELKVVNHLDLCPLEKHTQYQ